MLFPIKLYNFAAKLHFFLRICKKYTTFVLISVIVADMRYNLCSNF